MARNRQDRKQDFIFFFVIARDVNKQKRWERGGRGDNCENRALLVVRPLLSLFIKMFEN